MNKNNPIKLTDSKSFLVNIKDSNGKALNTNITLSYGNLPSLSCLLEKNEDENEIIAQSISDEDYGNFHLSEFYEKSIPFNPLFKYLYLGKADKDKINEVHFSIPELSSYFHNELKYDLDENTNISGKLKIEPLIAKVDSFVIEIRQGYELKSFEDFSGFFFKNDIYLSFKSDSTLSFQEIEKLMYSSINLFTWITGYSILIDSIEVFDGSNRGYLYIPIVKKYKNYDLRDIKSFMHRNIFRENFNIICNQYFNNPDIFSEIWTRTVPLFDFSGVFEYEVMLHTSILDKYFTSQVKKLDLAPLKNNNYEKYIIKVENFLKNSDDFKNIFKDSDLLSKLEVKKLFPKPQKLFLLDKQKLYFDYIGRDILSVFINNDDFEHIKKIRDKTAHGEKLPDSINEEKVFLSLYKVKMLTMFLIYLDLGITKDCFLKIISISLHPMIINSQINKKLLDIQTGKAIDIDRIENKENELKMMKLLIIILDKFEEKYYFNLDFSQKISDFFLDRNRITNLNNQSMSINSIKGFVRDSLLETGDSKDVEYYPNIYLSQGPNKKITNVVVISGGKTF